MTLAPVRLWLEISHHAPFAVGGWAWVRADGAAITGMAGGERRCGAEHIALAGLVAALDAAGPSPGLELRSASPAVLAIPARLRAAAAGEDAPQDDLPLWARAMTRLAGVRLLRVSETPQTPPAFVAAWAVQARDKARDAGPFAAAIPRANLARAGVPA